MTALSAVRDRLLGNATILSTVGPEQLYAVHLPQKATFPAISYFRVSDVPNEQLHGIPSAREPRIQVDIWCVTRAQVVILALAARTALHTVWTDGGILFQGRCVNEMDEVETEINGGLFRQALEFMVFHGTAGGTI